MSSHPRITALVLAHLAASPLFACRSGEQRLPEPVPAEAPVAAPSASSAVITDPPPPKDPPSDSPASSASAKPTPPPPKPPPSTFGKQCWTAKDCSPDLTCALPFNGARVIPGKPGTCRDPHALPGGRPLFVDGVPRVARSVDADSWHDPDATAARDARDPAVASLDDATRGTLRARFVADALDEHASVAAFARTICQLVALGAPGWLVEKTQRALADEIVHAKEMIAWCRRLGATVCPGALPEAAAPFPAFGDDRALAKALLRDVVRGGCVGETLAAHDLAARAVTAPLPELRELFARTAADEARHAALAYETAIWIARAFPALAPEIGVEKDRSLAERSADERELLAPLFANVHGA